MFGLSFGELLIIFGVALLVLGPKGLPQLARTIGKTLRQFRGVTADLRHSMEEEFYAMDADPSRPPPPAARKPGTQLVPVDAIPRGGQSVVIAKPVDPVVAAMQAEDANLPSHAVPDMVAAHTRPSAVPATSAPVAPANAAAAPTAAVNAAPVGAANATPAAPAPAVAPVAAPDGVVARGAGEGSDEGAPGR